MFIDVDLGKAYKNFSQYLVKVPVHYENLVFERTESGAEATHDTHDPHGLHIGTYKFRLRTGYTKLFVRNKLQVRAVHDRA